LLAYRRQRDEWGGQIQTELGNKFRLLYYKWNKSQVKSVQTTVITFSVEDSGVP